MPSGPSPGQGAEGAGPVRSWLEVGRVTRPLGTVARDAPSCPRLARSSQAPGARKLGQAHMGRLITEEPGAWRAESGWEPSCRCGEQVAEGWCGGGDHERAAGQHPSSAVFHEGPFCHLCSNCRAPAAGQGIGEALLESEVPVQEQSPRSRHHPSQSTTSCPREPRICGRSLRSREHQRSPSW